MIPSPLPTLVLASVLLLLASGCTVGRPFSGPGFDPSRGVTAEGAGDTVVVAVTHTTVSWRWAARRTFSHQLWEVVESMPEQRGLVGYSVRRKLFGKDAWTLSVWTSEEALSDFLKSAPHRAAVRDGGPTLTSLRYARAEVPVEQIPVGWPWALDLIESQAGGRR